MSRGGTAGRTECRNGLFWEFTMDENETGSPPQGESENSRTPHRKLNRRSLFRIAGAGTLAGMAGLAWKLRPARANPFYDGPASDHFDGRVFFNPGGTPPGSFSDLLKWQFSGNRAKWPERFESPHAADRPPARVEGDDLRVTHVGHASFLIQVNGLNLLTDPVWSQRASPVSFAGPLRVNDPGIAFDDLPKIDAVLLTHSHYDHMDVTTLSRLVAGHDPLIITPLGNDKLLHQSVRAARTAVADWGETVTLPANTAIHFDPCHHWGARSLNDRRMTLWCAFTIETPSLRIHHVGDTGFHEGINFRKAAERHGDFDLAILPIGAYEPRWFMRYQHINPDEAVEAFRLLGARRAIGHHWGTFQLTDEPVSEPAERLASALAAGSIDPGRFIAGRPGQVWLLREWA